MQKNCHSIYSNVRLPQMAIENWQGKAQQSRGINKGWNEKKKKRSNFLNCNVPRIVYFINNPQNGKLKPFNAIRLKTEKKTEIERSWAETHLAAYSLNQIHSKQKPLNAPRRPIVSHVAISHLHRNTRCCRLFNQWNLSTSILFCFVVDYNGKHSTLDTRHCIMDPNRFPAFHKRLCCDIIVLCIKMQKTIVVIVHFK